MSTRRKIGFCKCRRVWESLLRESEVCPVCALARCRVVCFPGGCEAFGRPGLAQDWEWE